jgi:replicative DNA helicase
MIAATQVPPHNLDAERSVLGAMLLDPAMIDEVTLHLNHKDFYQHAHQLIYQTILKITERSSVSSVDLVTLSERIAADKLAEQVGGYGYLAKLYDETPTAANAPFYARIVKAMSVRRQLIYAAAEIQREAFDPSDPDGLLDHCEKLILTIRETRRTEIKTLEECAGQVLDRVDQVGQGKTIGVKTGLMDLDGLILLKPEELVIVAARPSVGKSILGHQIAMNFCHQAMSVFFASVEMPGIDIAARILSSAGSIDSTVTAGRRPPTLKEAEQLSEAYTAVSNLQFWIDDSPYQTVQNIAASARRLHRQHKLALIVVDYLQLIAIEKSKNQTRAEALGEVSRGLKRLARELHLPVLALAQLNRDADGEPELHMIRESGDIEQDADIVIMPWRDKDPMHSSLIHLKIAKHRNGPIGTVDVFHRKEFVRFDHYVPGFQPMEQPLIGATS